jgi:hypothetical protein
MSMTTRQAGRPDNQTGRLKRETTCDERKGEGDGEGAKSYDGKKTWSSVNHSIISNTEDLMTFEYLLICGS